jgi:hypothetical protein
MRLHDLALASARVAITSEKASDELSALLEKWFAKHLVKGITLPGLRAMHNAGALKSFLECLPTRSEADVIAILRKVDPHGVAILTRPRAEMEAHVRDLATGRIGPALDVEGIVKTIKLPKLRALHDTGALGCFFEGLATRNAADLISVLRKVDPHRGDILNRPRPDMETHLRDLAAGRVGPAQKPKPSSKPKTPSKPKTTKESSTKSAQTDGIYERSRNLS